MSATTALGYTPQYVILKDGEDITGHFNDRVVMIKVESKSSGGEADSLDISLDDRDYAIAAVNTSGPDATSLAIAMGYLESGVYAMGNFNISEAYYEFPPKTLRLVGNNLGFTNNAKAPMITAHTGETLQSIVGGIAKLAGMEASVDPDLGSKTVAYLNQHCSSMHLLQELERRYGAMAHFGDGRLSFVKRGTATTSSGGFFGGVALTPEDLATYSMREMNRVGYSKVRAAYWDANTHEKTWLQSSGKPYTGSTVPFMIKRIFATKEEAQDGANAKLDVLNRGFRSGQITLAKGDPSIRAGSACVISGTRDGVDGSYVIKTATHTFTKRGGIATTLDVYDPGDGASFADAIEDATPLTTPAGSDGIGSA